MNEFCDAVISQEFRNETWMMTSLRENLIDYLGLEIPNNNHFDPENGTTPKQMAALQNAIKQ